MDGGGGAESEKSQQGFHLYLRLNTLLNDYGGAALRDIFRLRYENLIHKKWEDGSQTSKDFHKTVGKSVFKSAKPIQRAMLQKGDLNEWDLALLSTVLQNIDYTNGSARVLEQHENENKAIKELITVRNRIEHLSGKSISVSDFNVLWKTASGNLVSLDVSVEEIDYIRSCANLHGSEFKPTNENHVNAENYLKAKGLKNEGNAATRSNELNKALQLYTKALNLYGVPLVERGIIYSNRSSVYLRILEENATSSEDEVEQNYKLAKEDAEKVIGLRPTWWKGYYRLGRVLQFKKEWKPAMVAFDQALGLNMGDKEILNARDACRFKERSEEIQEHIQPCILQNKLDSSEMSKKLKRERGMVDMDVKSSLVRNKLYIDSNYPEFRSYGLIMSAHRHLLGIDSYTQNYEKAAELFSKAAKIGNAEALYNMGLLHQKGMGVVIDFELAVEYFEKAVKCPMNGFLNHNKIGVVAAQYALGKCYHDGVGKSKDFVKAAKWYSLASQNGCGQASNNVAFLYRDGFGVEQSLEKAIQYWKLAASQGEILGMENLAYAHLYLGNVDEAEKWFSQSINAGNLSATLKQKQFRKCLEQMRQLNKKIKDVTSSVAASGQDISGITIFKIFAKEIESLSSSSMLPGKTQRISDEQSVVSKFWKRENEIRLKAAQKAALSSESNEPDKSRLSDPNTAVGTLNLKRGPEANISQMRNTSPMRIHVVLNYRKHFKYLLKTYLGAGASNQERGTSNPLNVQKLPSQLTGLKEIKIDEMNPTTDHVYSSTVLHATIMEDGIFYIYTSIYTVIKDDNGDFRKCYVYNFNQKDVETRKKFSFGSRISILNPYHRLTTDLGFGIRIDDPQSVVFHSAGDDTPICRFCCKPDPAEHCSKCKRAKYCDRKCQLQDWSMLKHGLICRPLDWSLHIDD